MTMLPSNINEVPQRESIHTTTFVKSTRGVNQQTSPSVSGGLIECGYAADGRALPIDYLVRITSIRNRCTIISPIQEPLVIRVESRWEPFIPSSLLNEGNVLTQMITGGKTSLITKASSRRLWQGSSPMTLSLNLKFEAVNDPFIEVTEAVRLLQTIALPSDPSGGKGLDIPSLFGGINNWDVSQIWKALSTVPLLSPPGPTPFTLEGILNTGSSTSGANKKVTEMEIREGLKGGDIIIVEWGRLLTFYNVVVKEVTPSIPPVFDKNGDPIKATVNIVFETYEMMTVEALEKTYIKHTPPPA